MAQIPVYTFNPNSGLFKNSDSDNFPLNISNNPNGVDILKDFHVTALKNKFKDVARPNLFKIKIVPPQSLLKDFDSEKNGLLTVLAKKASFPQMKVGEYIYERSGQKLHIPTNEIDHGELNITFINDSNFVIRSLFNRWQRLVLYNWKEYTGTNVQESLAGEISIYQYDGQLNEVYAIKVNNAWPITLSAIELGQDITNTAEEFTVDFRFTNQEIFKSYN